MIPDLELVIGLQSLDHRIAGLDKEIASLPKHIAQIEKALDQHIRKLEADRAALSANQKERKRLEGDIQVQEQKISKLKGQMLEAKTNEVYRAFQHEIEFCEQEIRKAEDRILELMTESEPLDGNVKAAEASLNREKQQVEAEKKSARERTATDQRQLELLKAERRTTVERLSPKLYSDYERLRKKRRGVAVADATDGCCNACQMVLRPQFFQDLKRGDGVLYCESCGRIVYYNPPVIFDEGSATEASLPAQQSR